MSQQAQATPNQKLSTVIGGNQSSIPGLSSPSITEKQNLPSLNYPRKSLNLSLPQNYQAYKSQSESPFAMRNKSNTQKNYINNNSNKLDKIEETSSTNIKNKIAFRQNRSISPSFNEKSQIKNTLNIQNQRNGNKITRQQTVGDSTLKNSNTSNQSSRLKTYTLQNDSKIVTDKVQKILQNTIKNTQITISASQQTNNCLQQQKTQFANQKLQGSQVILIPKVSQQVTSPHQNENKSAAAKKSQPQLQKENSAQNNNCVAPSDNLLKFYVGGGNNCERIRKLMNKREGWVETKDPTSMFVNFKWQQTTRGYKFEKLIENNSYKQVVNHFEFHKEITNKQYLVKNLMTFAESMKQNVFEITPLTYVIDFNDENCDLILNNFLKFFEMNMPTHIKKKQSNIMNKAADIRKILRSFQTQYGQQSTEKLFNYFYTRWSLNDTFLDKNNSTYMWILKPTFLNRGRGIHVFNSLNSLEKLMSDYTEGFEEKSLKKQDKKEDETEKVEEKVQSIRESQNNKKMTQSQPNIIIDSQIKTNFLNDELQESINFNKDTSQSQSMQKLPSPERQFEVEEKDIEEKANENQKHGENENYLSQGEISSPEIKKISYNGNNFQIKRIRPLQSNRIITIPPQKSMTISNINTVISNNIASASLNNAANNKFKENKNEKFKDDPNKYIRVVPTGPCLLKASQFVVQKYIEKPLLINQRKFDIRVWALVTHNLDVYFFREGYMRLSSSLFTTDEKQLDNLFIHLTNNAIQKYSDNYGQFENGNMWSFQKLWEFLETNYQNDNSSIQTGTSQTEQERKPQKHYKKRIVSKIKDIIWLTFCSIKKKLNQNDRKFCFEIFGFDFLIDEELNSWLIEVNTNPAIDECSQLLKTLIPRALDDALKLTVDQIFTKKPATNTNNANNKNSKEKSPVLQSQKQNNIETENEKKVKDQIIEKPVELEVEEEDYDQNDQFELNSPIKQYGDSSPTQIKTDVQEPEFYPVPGYEDNFNMWELLGNLKDSSNIQVKKKFKQMK